MTEIDTIIDKVRAKVYSRYRTRTDIDDLMQEAAFFAWKKWTQYPDWDDTRIIYHAAMRAQSLVSDKSGDVPTGKPVNVAARRKQANGDATREKLRNYLRDYVKLHGEEPSNSQAARDLGMSANNVRFHRERLYLFDGSVDKSERKLYSLDAALDSDEGEIPSWINSISPVVVDYESVAVGAEVRRAVRTLSERDRLFLYMEFWQDKKYVEIAKALGCGGAYVNKMRKRILTKLEAELAI